MRFVMSQTKTFLNEAFLANASIESNFCSVSVHLLFSALFLKVFYLSGRSFLSRNAPSPFPSSSHEESTPVASMSPFSFFYHCVARLRRGNPREGTTSTAPTAPCHPFPQSLTGDSVRGAGFASVLIPPLPPFAFDGSLTCPGSRSCPHVRYSPPQLSHPRRFRLHLPFRNQMLSS